MKEQITKLKSGEIVTIDDLNLKPLSKKQKEAWKKIRELREKRIPAYAKQQRIEAGRARIISEKLIIGG